MSVHIKTTADGRALTVNGHALYLDGIKEADDIEPVMYHPNRDRILEIMPDATHMAGRVPLTLEQAALAFTTLKQARQAYAFSEQGIAERIRLAQNKAMANID